MRANALADAEKMRGRAVTHLVLGLVFYCLLVCPFVLFAVKDSARYGQGPFGTLFHGSRRAPPVDFSRSDPDSTAAHAPSHGGFRVPGTDGVTAMGTPEPGGTDKTVESDGAARF